MNRESVLARTMVELADNLVDDFDIVDLLTTLSDRCVDVLDVAAAGIMLVTPSGDLQLDHRRRAKPCASSNCSSCRPRRTLPGLLPQSAAGRQPGPHRSRRSLAPVRPGRRQTGFRSADAIPMRLRGEIIGALNLFRTETGSLNADDVLAAQALADIATIAILQNRNTVATEDLNDQLEKRSRAASSSSKPRA